MQRTGFEHLAEFAGQLARMVLQTAICIDTEQNVCDRSVLHRQMVWTQLWLGVKAKLSQTPVLHVQELFSFVGALVVNVKAQVVWKVGDRVQSHTAVPQVGLLEHSLQSCMSARRAFSDNAQLRSQACLFDEDSGVEQVINMLLLAVGAARQKPVFIEVAGSPNHRKR